MSVLTETVDLWSVIEAKAEEIVTLGMQEYLGLEFDFGVRYGGMLFASAPGVLNHGYACYGFKLNVTRPREGTGQFDYWVRDECKNGIVSVEAKIAPGVSGWQGSLEVKVFSLEETTAYFLAVEIPGWQGSLVVKEFSVEAITLIVINPPSPHEQAGNSFAAAKK